MTDHDPSAAEVLTNARREWRNGFHVERQLGLTDAILDALTAAGLAVVRVDTVPPWMERATHAEHFGGDLYILRGET